MTKLMVAFHNFANAPKKTFDIKPTKQFGKNAFVKLCGHSFFEFGKLYDISRRHS
jgi:hypothetical protein